MANKLAEKTAGIFLLLVLSIVVLFAFPITALALGNTGPATNGLSADASLKSLTASAGTLYPTFSPDTTEYVLGLDDTTKVASFVAAAKSSGATVLINGAVLPAGGTSKAFSLARGETVVTIQVTAQDGSTTKSYTIHAVRMPYVWQKTGAMPYSNAYDGFYVCDDRGSVYFASGNAIAKYSAGQWVQVGEDAPQGAGVPNSHTTFSMCNGVPYVAFCNTDTAKAYVYKLSGTK